MEMADLISTFGAWGVVVIAFFWQAKTTREDRNAIEERHSNEVHELSEVINNNTVAITRLCEKLGKEIGE